MHTVIALIEHVPMGVGVYMTPPPTARSVAANNPQEAAKQTHFGAGVLRDTRSVRLG